MMPDGNMTLQKGIRGTGKCNNVGEYVIKNIFKSL